MRLRALLPVIAALAASALAPAAASASSCEYDDPSDTLNVSLDVSGEFNQVSRGSGGAIQVFAGTGGVLTCAGGTPTATNIDTINFIDMTAGGSTRMDIEGPENFAPGKTAEPAGQQFSEIEMNFVMGTGTADEVTVHTNAPTVDERAGTMGVNWDAGSGDPGADADITVLAGVDTLVLTGSNANDVISAQGGAGTGSPVTGPRVRLYGGAGSDVLAGGNAPVGDDLYGAADNDDLSGHGGNDVLWAYTGANRIDGGPGRDLADYETKNPPPYPGARVDLGVTVQQNTIVGEDTITGIEDLLGSAGPDTLIGGPGPNEIRAGEGDDTVGGGLGDDRLEGGAGVNTLTYAGSQSGVTADLGAGTATGEGADSFTAFDSLTGSSLADRLTGNGGANVISPGPGADTVSALGGADLVELRDGEADTAACGTELDQAKADAPRLDTVDPDCDDITVVFEPGGGPAGDPGGGGDGGGDPPAEDREVQFELTAKPTQRVLARRRLVVTASCLAENCAVTVDGSKALRPATESLASGVPERIKVALKRKRARDIAAAFERGRNPKLTVAARATDGAGNVATASVRVAAAR